MIEWRSMQTQEQTIIIEDGRGVALIDKHLTEGEREHYAALIVQAVNSHDAAETFAMAVENATHLPDDDRCVLCDALVAYRASKEVGGD